MKENHLLTLVKIIHSIIWLCFVTIIFYVTWSGISGDINGYTWLGIVLVLGEGIVLLLFDGHCPLTNIARKYSDSNLANFDIFLPEWLAKYNKVIFTSIFVVALVIILFQKLHP